MSFVWQQGGRMAEMVLGLLISVMIARLLGPEKAGILAQVGAIQGSLVTMIAFGFEESLTNFLGQHAQSAGIVSYLLRQMMKWRVVCAVVAMGLLALFAGVVARWENVVGYEWAIILLVIFGILSSVSSLMTYSLIALFDVRINNTVRAVSLAIQLVLVYVLIKAGYGLAGAIWAQIAGTAVFFLGLIPSIARRMIAPPEPVPLRPVLGLGLGIWVTSVVNLIIGKQLPVLLLGAFAVGPMAIAYFNYAFNTRFFADTLLVLGLAGIALAAAARLREKSGREGLGQAWRLNIRLATLLAVPCMVFVLFQGAPTIKLLYGPKFVPAAPALPWMLPLAILARVFGGGASSTVMSAGGMVRLVVKQYLIAGAVGAILCPIALLAMHGRPPMDSVIAAAAAVSVSQVLVSVLGFSFVRKTYHVKFPTALTLKVIVASVIAGASTLVYRWHANSRMAMLFVLAAEFAVVFYIVCRLLKPLSREDYEVAVKASRRVPKLLRPLVERFDETPPEPEPLAEASVPEDEVVVPDEEPLGPL